MLINLFPQTVSLIFLALNNAIGFVFVLLHAALPSMLWCWWLGWKKGIQPVKKLSGGVLAWCEVQMICTWSSWCHCHRIVSCSIKIQNGLPFWCQITQIVLENRPLNDVVVVVVTCCFSITNINQKCGPMPNVMATLPNIGGALCSMLQKFGWRPLLECGAVTQRRRETGSNLQGCQKLTKWSQPRVGRSSPYYGNMWRYCGLSKVVE